MRLIDADELIEKLNEYNEFAVFDCEAVKDLIDNAPTVEYPFYQEAYQTGYEEGKNERPQGEWVIDNWGMYHCNYCMKEKQQLFNNFCSFCGAYMRGKEE